MVLLHRLCGHFPLFRVCRTFPGSLYREGEFPDFTLINLPKSEFSQLLDPYADNLSQELIAGLGSHFPGPVASLCPFMSASLPATHIPWDQVPHSTVPLPTVAPHTHSAPCSVSAGRTGPARCVSVVRRADRWCTACGVVPACACCTLILGSFGTATWPRWAV